MRNKTTISAILWAANAVALGCVYIIERNLKLEKKRQSELQPGVVKVDLRGTYPINVDFNKKMLPEFTIYQV